MSSVSPPSYLLLTPKGYFFRIRVPNRLQAKIGKRELKKAIAGANRLLAERQAILYAAQAIRLFQALEGSQMKDEELTQQMFFRLGQEAEIHLDPDNLPYELSVLLQNPDFRARVFGKQPVSQSTTQVEAIPATVDTPASGKKTAISDRMLLSDAVAVYLLEREKKDSLFDEYRKKELNDKFDLLIEIIGDMPIGDVTYTEADNYRGTYQSLPRNRTSKKLKEMSVKELIALDHPIKVSKETINQRLDTISALYKWFQQRIPGLINPFAKMSIKRLKNESASISKRRIKLPFDSADLKKVFSDRIWTKHRHEHDWEYWLPLILLYTGARVTEACQLLKSDFMERDDVWFMSINDMPTPDEPDDIWPWQKRVKTGYSVRDIPIHAELLRLGLRTFVNLLPQNQHRLFPDIKPVANKLAAYPCKKFNDYVLKRTGAKVKEVKTFYSLRHTTLNVLKQQGISSEERAQVAGHASPNGNTTEDVYGDDFNIGLMKTLVERLDFREATKDIIPWMNPMRLEAVKKRRKKHVPLSADRVKRRSGPSGGKKK